ncbi:MAG: ATP-binding protein [Oscillospiraceae bacterium]|nr:ATP-binding protein [Oscillospiraceae bacterium]
MYSANIMHLARQELARRKEDSQSQYRQRIQEAYAKVPRLRQIDLELRRTMTQAAQAVFTRGGDAVAAMEQVKKENLALQQERKALEEKYFTPGYLEEKPICDRCGGSGYLGTDMCRCLHTLCVAEQKKELSRLCTGQEKFENFRLDLYADRVDPELGVSPRAVMEKTFNRCRQYAADFQPGIANLLFNGGTGLGKTFLSACIADSVADKGFSVVYESAPQLFTKLEKNRFEPTEQTRAAVDAIMGCDLLIVDDLGTEMPGNFVTAALYALLNDRLLENKSMLISTNLNADEIAARYSGQIASRLLGNFKTLTFVGQDIRILKNRGL